MSYRGSYNRGVNGESNVPTAFGSPGVKSLVDNTAVSHYIASFEKFTKKIEDLTEIPVIAKAKPYIPGIARFLIVATFYEDSLRIIAQWTDQVFYLYQWKRYPYLFVLLFLSMIVVCMLCGSTLLILRKCTVYATGVLCGCIVVQSLVYGLYTGSSFLLRNISVIGGLLIAFSDTIVKSKATFSTLPELSSKTDKNRGYLLLVGRMLIVLMFVVFTFSKSWFTVFLTMFGTVCFAAGYKIKFASILLGLILAFYNIMLNNYWFYDSAARDFLKYEFYQNLSIIGALLLVTNTGAGEISIDEQKKTY